MRTTDPADTPDPAAPLPVLPVCATCAHPRIAHRRRRCREPTDRDPCDCPRFTEPPADPPGGYQDPDTPEDLPRDTPGPRP